MMIVLTCHPRIVKFLENEEFRPIVNDEARPRGVIGTYTTRPALVPLSQCTVLTTLYKTYIILGDDEAGRIPRTHHYSVAVLRPVGQIRLQEAIIQL